LDKNQRPRFLTEGEKNLVREVLGDGSQFIKAPDGRLVRKGFTDDQLNQIKVVVTPSLDLHLLTRIYKELNGEFMAAAFVAWDNTVHCSPAHYYDDFSQADEGRKGLFLHEITHIWQGMSKIKTPEIYGREIKANEAAGHSKHNLYKYNLENDLKFFSMGTEQQARLLQDTYLNREGWKGNRSCWEQDRRRDMLKDVFAIGSYKTPCKNMDMVAEAAIKGMFMVPTLLVPSGTSMSAEP
ncbi:MAG: hypothetical protein ACT4OY_08320, partial [Alphaproteobacteria bacterium]